MKTKIRYFEKILNQGLPNMDHIVRFLDERCDSQLEVAFALCIVAKTRISDYYPEIEGEFIVIDEPFNSSPTSNGVSRAFLGCQHPDGIYTWDFSLWVAHNNGHPQEKSDLSLLVDVDGYGIHKNRRGKDQVKVDQCASRCVKLLEEGFKNIEDMADLVLHSSVWHCDCNFPVSGDYYQCDVHSRLQLRSINNWKRDFTRTWS